MSELVHRLGRGEAVQVLSAASPHGDAIFHIADKDLGKIDHAGMFAHTLLASVYRSVSLFLGTLLDNGHPLLTQLRQTKVCADASHQLAGRKWLDQIVVGPGVDPFHRSLFPCSRR